MGESRRATGGFLFALVRRFESSPVRIEGWERISAARANRQSGGIEIQHTRA
jgi:hypothetical protein